jgi:hypothetical protein
MSQSFYTTREAAKRAGISRCKPESYDLSTFPGSDSEVRTCMADDILIAFACLHITACFMLVIHGKRCNVKKSSRIGGRFGTSGGSLTHRSIKSAIRSDACKLGRCSFIADQFRCFFRPEMGQTRSATKSLARWRFLCFSFPCEKLRDLIVSEEFGFGRQGGLTWVRRISPPHTSLCRNLCGT